MKRGWSFAAGVILAAVMAAPGAALAAPKYLNSITDKVKTPVRVALDSQGNVYVTETSSNAVRIYNRSGQYQKALTVSNPFCAVVDSSGNLYVGRMLVDGSGEVDVYTPDLTFAGSLGSGAGEFSMPNSIAVDGSGMVYVVDGKNNVVKVYGPANLSGAPVLTIGGSGSADGQFTKPTAAAVSDAAGEIYVTDLPLTQTANGTTNGARIQVFDKTSGAFKRSFGQFGTNAGQMTFPADIAVDKAGRLYVVDNYQGAVLIMDPATGASITDPVTGAPLALYDTTHPLATPLGVAIGKNNIAYVASYMGHSVDVYALDSYVTLDVSPSSLSFSAVQYNPNPASQTVTISNSGSGTLNWTASTTTPWITLGQSAGTAGPAGASQLTIGVNTANLTPNSYTGTVSITSDFGQTSIVTVTLVVLPPPILSLSNGWLTFTTKKGQNPASQQVTVTLTNTTALSWSATTDSSWLSITPASGNTTATATVTVNAANPALAPGAYTGNVTFLAPGAIGDGSKLTVNLTVTQTSKIVVTTNLAQAAFTLTGPAAYSGSGQSWSVEDAPAGDYTVTFTAVAGYKKPLSQTKTLPLSGELDFTGAYVSFKDLAARKNIVTAKGPGPKSTAELKAYKNDGTATAFDLTALDTLYGANVAVADIDGDGVAELIVGAGPGPDNPAIVRIYKADGTKLLEFTPFTSFYGVNVAAADLNGDGAAELIVSPGPGPDNPGTVRIYAYDKAANQMKPTGVDITAHSYFYGANVAAADINGDGKLVLLTAPGPGADNPAAIKIWAIDTTQGMGAWSAAEVNTITLSGKYGVNIAAGDVDGDGKDEIIVGAGPDPLADAVVRVLKADGTELTHFTAFDGKYGVTVSAADLDGDGKAEIIAGLGPDAVMGGNAPMPGGKIEARNIKDILKKTPASSGSGMTAAPASSLPEVKVYSGAGELKFTIRPYDDAGYGVKTATGDMGL